MAKSFVTWVFLIAASFAAIVEPAPKLVFGFCTVCFLFWLAKIFSWGEHVKENPLPRARSYIFFFMMFYSFLVYLFSLAFCAVASIEGSSGSLMERVKVLGNSLYFSIATATTLGHYDEVLYGFPRKFLLVLEVSFGVVFIAAILTVVLSLRNSSSDN